MSGGSTRADASPRFFGRAATRLVLAVFAVVASALAGCSRSSVVTDKDGHLVDPLADRAATTALVFVSTECPVSNRYAPEIRRLQAEFAPRGVTFYLVYPWADDDAVAVREHVRAFGFTFGALRDPEHVLVQRSGATVTPEVAVFSRGALVYRGRIDDRQVDFGQTRPEPTRRDLEIALDQVVAGHPVDVARTTSIGCAIPAP